MCAHGHLSVVNVRVLAAAHPPSAATNGRCTLLDVQDRQQAQAEDVQQDARPARRRDACGRVGVVAPEEALGQLHAVSMGYKCAAWVRGLLRLPHDGMVKDRARVVLVCERELLGGVVYVLELIEDVSRPCVYDMYVCMLCRIEST